jgi:hypothetical protein
MNNPADWKSTYESLMKNRGFHEQFDSDGENRKHARLAFKTGTTIAVQMEPVACQIINISVGGISFYSDIPLPSGQSITINLNNELSLFLRVDSCHMEELEPILMVSTHKYVVGAMFLTEEDGYRVMAEVLKSHGASLFELTI